MLSVVLERNHKKKKLMAFERKVLRKEMVHGE